VQLSRDDWNISADTAAGELTISQTRLGTVLRHVRLSIRGAGNPTSIRNWSLEKVAEDELRIRTQNPPNVWVFKISPNELRISAASSDVLLTAQAPAPSQRIVARLLDPRGAPVDWSGTAEVAGTYGGSFTRNVSYLPARNPEVMYFSLGQASASPFHSLFDRAANIAVDFPEQTAMRRDALDPDVLDISMPVPGNARIRILPDYFIKVLGVPFYVPFDDSYFKSAPMVWSSWTSYYAQVREDDIVQNADWIAAHLKPYGFQYVQLDDGYDRGSQGEHYWIEKWDQQKFSHGPKWLGDYIKSKGLHAGIWLVPNAYAGAVEEHPDWYIHFTNGKLVPDYSTPVLDSTNPAVLDFLKKEMTKLDDWGFEYYKFDGEHAVPKYAPGVDLTRLYDESINPIAAYRNRLKVIRDTIGPHRFIEGCPAGTPLNGMGFMNSYFNGDDLYDSWQGMYALFSSINANTFFNHILAYNMPGEGIAIEPPLTVEEAGKKRLPEVIRTVRTRESPVQGFGTTLPEARTVVSYVALTGVAYSVASVMAELPPERVQLLHQTLPTMPILPMDLFSRGTDMSWDKFKHTTPDEYIHNYPEILDLKVNAASGTYDVAAMTNWRSSPATRTLDFKDKLGLDSDGSYVAFDFWSQKIAGVFKGSMNLEIAPHDTRVFLLHALLNHPQLVGNSRHITGAYSILDVAWDTAKRSLRGSSQSVLGDDYSVWIFVPREMPVSQVKATAANSNVPIRQEREGESLKLTFQGQKEPVDWTVEFSRR
jgi:Melibiase/Alpha galactosidase C-terminal beta sandwich domain